MEITQLPSAEKIVEIIGEYKHGRTALACEMRDRVTQDRNQAYTSLIEGIGGMPTGLKILFDWVENEVVSLSKEELESLKELIDQQKIDIIEKVVKPLYNKE